MTPEQREKQRQILLLKKRKLELERERELATATPEPDPKDESWSMDDSIGLANAVNRGTMVGWGDEVSAFGRAALDSILPETEADRIAREEFGGQEQSFGDRYRMYQQDAEKNLQDFEARRPKTAMAATLAGGLASPINRIAPGVGRAPWSSIGRGAAEGAVAGLGEAKGGSTLEEAMIEGAKGATTGGVLSGAFSGLGKAGRIISGRGDNPNLSRIAENLDQPDGSFKPIQLADNEGGLAGDIYRNVFGRSWGRKNLVDQETPFVERALKKAVEMDEQLIRASDQADDLLKTRIQGASTQAANRLTELDAAAANAIDDAARGGTAKAASRAARFRRQAAQAADPQGVLKDTNLDRPKEVANKLDDYWKNEAFQEVKSNWFDFDETLGNKITARIKSDPDLRLYFGDEIIPKLQKMQSRLTDQFPPGTDIVPEDFIEEMLKGKYQISGDALMAMRNAFATGANGSSKNSYPLRSVAREFDDFILSQLDDNAAALYRKNLDQYTTALSYMNAVRSKGARKANGEFTPDQWMSASGKYGGKGMSSRQPPLEAKAAAYNRGVQSAPVEAKQQQSALRKAKAQQAKSVRKQESRLKNAAQAERTRAKRDIRDSRRVGEYAQAVDDAKSVARKATPENVSGLSQALTTKWISDMTPRPAGLGTNAAVALASGTGLAKLASLKPVQRIVAGQSKGQIGGKQAADAIRRIAKEQGVELTEEAINRLLTMNMVGE